MSNNFTSGMAGPAAVELLNTLWDRVTEQIVGNSTTSLAIGTGTKTLTIEASKQFAIGQTARITYNSDINKWMQGTVSAYNATTGSLSISVDTISGSGTYAVWTVALTGSVGPTNTTELDDRVLADQQLLGAAAYATDMALQAVRELLRVEPKFDASIAALSATMLTYDTALLTYDTALLTYDTALEQMLNALAHLLDLSGVTARAISGGNVIVGAGTATNPSLTPFADPDTGLFFPAPNESALATGGVERVRLDANGRMGIGTTTPTSLLDVADDRLRIRTAKTPASAGAAGNAGEVCWDASYVYICTATNTWRRSAIAAW